MQLIQNFQFSLMEYWFKTSGLKRIIVGLCLWFIGLVLLPINMAIGFYMIYKSGKKIIDDNGFGG